jgi:hypothetical protein
MELNREKKQVLVCSNDINFLREILQSPTVYDIAETLVDAAELFTVRDPRSNHVHESFLARILFRLPIQDQNADQRHSIETDMDGV